MASNVARQLQHLLGHVLLQIDQARVKSLQHLLQAARRLLPLLGDVLIEPPLPFQRRLCLPLGKPFGIRVIAGLLDQRLLGGLVNFQGEFSHWLGFGLGLGRRFDQV